MKITASALLALVLALPGPAVSAGWDEVLTMLGPNDAAVAADKHGRILFAHNPDRHLVPASAIKLVTALVSLSVLGEDFRFKTEFYTDNEKNLYIKGYGDPLLISEQVESISEKLAARLGSVNDIVADDTYFAEKIEIPGTRSYSHQPYDSPAGALCVNFNTAAVKKTGSGYISAEPQTPLLPRVLAKARSFDAETGRILLSGKNRENLMYAGELFAHFLEKHGTEINGVIRPGTAKPAQHRLIYTHVSPEPLTGVVERLMEHSSNFTANQILIAAGAGLYGPPATLEKGLLAARTWSEKNLGICPQMVEGSGISRRNRMTAEMFISVLEAFEPYFRLLPEKDGIYYKTGTLDGISTRAGYIESGGELFRFAVLMNTESASAGQAAEKIASVLRSSR